MTANNVFPIAKYAIIQRLAINVKRGFIKILVLPVQSVLKIVKVVILVDARFVRQILL